MSDDLWVFGSTVTRLNGRSLSESPAFSKLGEVPDLKIRDNARYWVRFGKNTLKVRRDSFVSVSFHTAGTGTEKYHTPKHISPKYDTSRRRGLEAKARAEKV